MTHDDAMFLMEYMPDIWEKWADQHGYDTDTFDGLGNFLIELGKGVRQEEKP